MPTAHGSPGRALGHADVVVVGAGPAGLAVAAACAAQSLDTVVVDPDPWRRWPQTFGAWADELPEHLGESLWQRSWTDVRVETDQRSILLDRRYVLLDNTRVQDHLRGRLTGAGGVVAAGRVAGLRVGGLGVDARRLSLTLAGDATLRTRAVIDASGHRPALVTAPLGPPPAMQTAHGVIGRFDTPPAAPGAMTFMDLSTPRGAGAPAARQRGPGGDRRPSFLYAMDLGGGRWLAEETCLAARPAMSTATLARRLEARLARRGAVPAAVESTEHVAFPMGGPVPYRDQPVVGFGAAAGLVHPATGFSVAASLRLAPSLADAVAEAIRAGRTAAGVARAGWAAVWSADALRQRALHQVGLAAVQSLNAAQLQAFFEHFFELPPRQWRAYVSGAASARELAGIMLRLFAITSPGVKVALTRALVSNPGPLRQTWQNPRPRPRGT